MISRLRREAWAGRERADKAERLSARVEELSGFNSVLKSIMSLRERSGSGFDCLHI